MKLKSEYITQDVGDMQIMVAAGKEAEAFSGLVKSNKTAAFIVSLLKEETTEDAIVNSILDRYDVDRNTAETDVHKIIEQLTSIGAIK